MNVKIRKNIGILLALGATVVLAGALVLAVVLGSGLQAAPPASAENTGEATVPSLSAPTEPPAEPPTEPPTAPSTEPGIVKEATATVGTIGDLLMHMTLFNTAVVDEAGNYNLDSLFRYYLNYTSTVDFAIANLECTVAGNSNGYPYSGYPTFNCPEGILDALSTAGFDLLLTANNHTYDTGHVGLIHTQQEIALRGMQNLGTKLDAQAPNYIIQEINGIRIGMMCYTYEDDNKANTKTLNGRWISPDDQKLINSFDYYHLQLFYTEMAANMAAMSAEGVDATMLFIHWGNEYRLSPNNWQTSIAQRLCDLGIDVIVGGHPHVIEPVDLLSSTVDPNHKTVCIYSLGNAVSNQRKELMNLNTGHTEDGCMFRVTFAKYSDGTVLLESADVLPTWVNLHSTSGRAEYNILPLERQRLDGVTEFFWKQTLGLTDETFPQALASYERTMELVGPGLQKVNDYLQSQPIPQ